MTYLFIINPIAGKGKGLKYINKIEDYFKDKDDEFIIKLTEYKNHAKEIAKEYSSKADYHVFAIGGDGTVNEVLNGIIGTNSTLSIIPCGTGNDFVKTLYHNQEIDDYIEKLSLGQSTYIDIAKVNDSYYLNISSVGFDAEVVYNTKKFKYNRFMPSSLAYLAGVLYTAFIFKAIPLNIKVDNLTICQKTFLLTASNGKCYGGGIFITPEASITDGELDICSISKVSICKLLMSIGKAIKGNIKDIKEVTYYKGKKVLVTSEKEFSLNLDGELLRTMKAEFEIIPKGIKIMLPITASNSFDLYKQDPLNI